MIRPLWILCKYRTLSLGRSALAAGWAQLVVALAFLLLSAAIALGFFYFFSLAFPRLLAEPYSGPAVIQYVIELALAVVLVLGIASFVVSSSSLLFRNRDTENLFALPVPPEAVFWFRFAGVALMSAWPIFLVAVPALAALGVALNASLHYYLSMIPVLLLFSLLISVSGGVLSFLIAWLLRRIPLALTYGVETVLFIFVAAVGARRVINVEVFTLLGAITPQAAQAAEVRLQELFSSLPSHPFAKVILSVFPGQLGGTGSGLGWTAAAVGVLTLVLAFLARRKYLALWQDHGKGEFLARTEDVLESRPLAFREFPRFFKWGHGYLFEKDLLTLVRSPGELSRGLFMLALLLLYVFAVQIVASLPLVEESDILAGLVAFMYAALGYFTLTLGIRFAFPSFSLEGRGAWVLWASPLHAHEVLSWKYAFWTSLAFIIMEAITVLIIVSFSLPLLLAVFMIFVTACTVVSLMAITLCLGAIWPRFRDTNPDTMSTSPPGLLAAGLGLAYVWIVAGYVHSFATALIERGEADVLAVASILIVTLVAVTVHMFLGRRAVEKMEIAR